jgi:hypothetical protein
MILSRSQWFCRPGPQLDPPEHTRCTTEKYKKIFQYIVAGRLRIDDVNQQVTWVLESGVLN